MSPVVFDHLLERKVADNIGIEHEEWLIVSGQMLGGQREWTGCKEEKSQVHNRRTEAEVRAHNVFSILRGTCAERLALERDSDAHAERLLLLAHLRLELLSAVADGEDDVRDARLRQRFDLYAQQLRQQYFEAFEKGST